MEGPLHHSPAVDAGLSSPATQAGLIPRAVHMLWKSARDLEDKGWEYTFEGQMLEIVRTC
jgi:hypothetical protein